MTAPPLPDQAAATVREAVRLAPVLGVGEGVVADHLARMPADYPASVSARAIVRHAGMAAHSLDVTEVRTRVTPGHDPQDGIDDLDVVARDRVGLFSRVAGALALHRGSVVSVRAFTRSDGVAVDGFRVRRPDGASSAWWAAVEGDIGEAVAGRLALRARVAREAAAARRGRPRPAVVRITSGLGSQVTLEIHAEDRVGALYRIASALAELELDIAAVRIDSTEEGLLQVFQLRAVDGKPVDSDHAAEVTLAVRAALDDV